MKAVAALVASFMLASAAPAQEGRYSSSIPPERFRGLGAVVTVFVPFERLNEFCGVPPVEGKILLGCARQTKEGHPVVIMPDPCPAALNGEIYARIQCHENAHALGGWSGDHEY